MLNKVMDFETLNKDTGVCLAYRCTILITSEIGRTHYFFACSHIILYYIVVRSVVGYMSNYWVRLLISFGGFTGGKKSLKVMLLSFVKEG